MTGYCCSGENYVLLCSLKILTARSILHLVFEAFKENGGPRAMIFVRFTRQRCNAPIRCSDHSQIDLCTTSKKIVPYDRGPGGSSCPIFD